MEITSKRNRLQPAFRLKGSRIHAGDGSKLVVVINGPMPRAAVRHVIDLYQPRTVRSCTYTDRCMKCI